MIINRSALEKAAETCDPYAVSCMLIDTDGDKDSRFVNELYDIAEKSRSDEDGEITVMDYENRNAAANIKQVITEIVKILAYCFTALISVVCLLNLYNSIRGRAAERTKETAVLRSVGMTDRQLTKMHDLENLMIFGKGIGLAAVICAALSAVIRYSIVSYFGNVELPLPLLLSACIAAGIFAASSIMTRICTRDTEKDGIIEKIRRETV
jgi:ABC-type antimicrobial peptide transport system permease subunit